MNSYKVYVIQNEQNLLKYNLKILINKIKYFIYLMFSSKRFKTVSAWKVKI